MTEHFVGYVLNSLDEDTHQEVEAHLENNPDARAQVEKLRELLEPLAADREDADPPVGLVARAIGRVAENQCVSRPLPQAPVPPPTSFVGGRSLWRRADLAVAASLFLVAVGLTILGVFHVRQSWNITACQNNLREFHDALYQYQDGNNNKYPDVTKFKDRNVAGMFVPILISAGVLDKDISVRCPGNGDPKACPFPDLDNVASLSNENFTSQAPALSGCYAYSLGYQDDNGFYHCPHTMVGLQANTPILADCPPTEGATGNSRNHGARGQNVLFQDGHFVFIKSRFLGEDDIYLNKDGKVAAGKGADDCVLGSSASKP